MNQAYRSFYPSDSSGDRSASVVVPLLMDMCEIKSVVDVGCGSGIWLAQFGLMGVNDVQGVDGEWALAFDLKICSDKLLIHNLSNGLRIKRTFDLALCLEVAEHLTEEHAARLVSDLTHLAPVVYFSAAIPYQEGIGHLNCQWPEYWADLFAMQGYVCSDCVRSRIWSEPSVYGWYKQNGILYVRQSYFDSMAGDHPVRLGMVKRPERLVHEDIFIMSGRMASWHRDMLQSPRYNVANLLSSIIRKWRLLSARWSA